MGAEFALQGFEEGAQQGISDAAEGNGAYSLNQILNPFAWTDSQVEAGKMGLAGALPILGGMHLVNHFAERAGEKTRAVDRELEAQQAELDREIEEQSVQDAQVQEAQAIEDAQEAQSEPDAQDAQDALAQAGGAGAVEHAVSGFLGQTMENGRNGCVEAVTKIGAGGSSFLAQELENGVVYVPKLVADAGERAIPFDEGQLEAGDLIIYGDDDHVVMYDGKGGYVGNSSSENQVVHKDNYKQMGMEPTRIIKTGFAGAPAGKAKAAQDLLAHAADDTQEVRDFYDAFAHDMLASVDTTADVEALRSLMDRKGRFQNTAQNREALARAYQTELLDYAARVYFPRRAMSAAPIRTTLGTQRAKAAPAAPHIETQADALVHAMQAQDARPLPPSAAQETRGQAWQAAQQAGQQVQQAQISSAGIALPQELKRRTNDETTHPQAAAPAQDARAANPNPDTESRPGKAQEPPVSRFAVRDFLQGQTGETIPAAKFLGTTSRPKYEAVLALAKQNGGQYNREAKQFLFPTAERRDTFVQTADRDVFGMRPVQSAPSTPRIPSGMLNGVSNGVPSSVPSSTLRRVQATPPVSTEGRSMPIENAPQIYAGRERDAEIAGANSAQNQVQETPASVEQNIQNGMKAMRQVVETHQDVPNAMRREDIGAIDFVWGKPGNPPRFKKGYGISHIVAKRDYENGSGKETAIKLVEVLAKGTNTDRQTVGNNPYIYRLRVHYDGYTAVLTPKQGMRNAWLLTGWEDNQEDNKTEAPTNASGEGQDSLAATTITPTRTRRDGDADASSASSVPQEAGKGNAEYAEDGQDASRAERLAWIDAHRFQYDKTRSMNENIMRAQSLAQEYIERFGTTNQIRTPERQALRRRIAEELYGDGAAKKEGKVWLVLGVPASGKSTFSDPLIEREGALLIDSDEAKKRLPEFSDGLLAGAVHEESAKIADDILARATANHDNMVLPLVGKTMSSLQKRINNLKSAGYEVNLIYVDLPIEKAIERTKTRFHETGRLVSPSYLRQVGLKPKENYDKLKETKEVDSYEAWDSDVERGSSPRNIERSARPEQATDQSGLGGRGQHARQLDESDGLRHSGTESRGTSLTKDNRSDHQDGFSVPEMGEDYVDRGGEIHAERGEEARLGDARFSVDLSREDNQKKAQFHLLQKTNPMHDDIHTGIRSVGDILSAEEAFRTKVDADESFTYPDFTQEDGEQALERGRITIYSSTPIKEGAFVSPSRMMAQDYAGRGKVYEKDVPVNAVAWINSDEGQYAPIRKSVDFSVNLSDNEDEISQSVFKKYLNEGIMKSTREKVQDEIVEYVNLDDMADPVKRDAARDNLPHIKEMLVKYNTSYVQSNTAYKNRMAVRIEYARRCFDNDERIQSRTIRQMDGNKGQKGISRIEQTTLSEFDKGRNGSPVRRGTRGVSRSVSGERQGAKAHFDKLYHDMAKSRSDKQDGFSRAIHHASPESRAAIDRLAEAMGAAMRDDKRAFPSPEQEARFKQAATALLRAMDGNVQARERIKGIRYSVAWHGSPHDFETFSLDHIGSGEGAQAHGWGLYFAEEREISEGYRDKLSGQDDSQMLEFNGDTFSKPEGYDTWIFRPGMNDEELVIDRAQILLLDHLYETEDLDETRQFFEKELRLEEEEEQEDEWRTTDYSVDLLRDVLAMLSPKEIFDEEVKAYVGKKGSLFQVEIPDEDVLLDEDNPLSEQPLKVRAAILKYYESKPDDYTVPESADDLGEQTGEAFLREVTSQMRREGSENPKKDASLLLNELGIEGITYDGYQDGRCYVIFDDKAIEILEKFSAKGEGAKIRRMLSEAKFLKEGELTEQERNLSALGEEMGTPVIWMDGNANLHGFHSDGITFLNRQSKMPLPQVFWHESFHYMRANNPALYDEMVRYVQKAERITDGQLDGYRKKIGRMNLSDADVIEEMLADRMQDVKGRVAFLKKMAREDKSLAERIAGFLRRMIDRFVEHFRSAGDKLSERQTAAMARAFSNVMRDMKGADGRPLFRVKGEEVRLASNDELPALHVVVTGDEFGEYTDIKDLRKKAKAYYRENLQGTHVNNPTLGEVNLPSNEISFSRRGLNKALSTAAKPNKLFLIKHLPDLIKSAKVVDTRSNEKEKREASQYTYLVANAVIGGEIQPVTISVFTDVNGNHYYNHILEEEELHKKRGVPVYSAQAFNNEDGIPTVQHSSATSSIAREEEKENSRTKYSVDFTEKVNCNINSDSR